MLILKAKIIIIFILLRQTYYILNIFFDFKKNIITFAVMNQSILEFHPLAPFLPTNAHLLMLGSFPPQQKRWCMDFYYPNWMNDMWRIMGHLFYDNKEHFVDKKNKCFRKNEIIEFAKQKGIALYDTATAIRRLKDNASDKFLEVVEPTNISLLLKQIPQCRFLVTTGQKATDTLCAQFEIKAPQVGSYTKFYFEDRLMNLYRMPSSSRAYPMKIEQKATYYAVMFKEMKLLQ